jgi:hypothetical protein
MLMLALSAAAVSSSTAPTLGKVLGFHQTASAACGAEDGNDDDQGDEDCQ